MKHDAVLGHGGDLTPEHEKLNVLFEWSPVESYVRIMVSNIYLRSI